VIQTRTARRLPEAAPLCYTARMILGISGPYAAGKGEVVAYLSARSFYPLSLSDVIRDELAARRLEETREIMIETGRALRAAHGPAVLAERLRARLEPDRNYVIDSIRHPAEVDALRAVGPRFRLIWVDADPELRFARLRERGRAGDPSSLAELRAMEAREQGGDDPAGQQLAAVAARADWRVRNDGSREELGARVQEILERSLEFERPSWDEYFLSIAQVVASRSNCVKRHVGAVIQRDRRLISTGYNGTPRGVRNCNEGGCPRCNTFAESGTRLDECLCSHAEENAIVQAAYHGASVRDGRLYTTFFPCLFCTKLIINAGLAEVVYNGAYSLDEVALGLLREAGVKVRQAPLRRDPRGS
jgi:dCMP deaminase